MKTVLALAMLLLLPTLAKAVDLRAYSETWYMDRGKKDFSIANYRAAIESFEKALELDPNNREAYVLLAQAYDKQGLPHKSVETYDAYLAKFPDDSETAFALAQILESPPYAYRQKDALKYYKMGLQTRDDLAMRYRYAALLGAHKETSREAIAQYELILQKDPQSARAQFGLAQAEAWNGALRKALVHARLAAQLQPDLNGLQPFLQNLESSVVSSPPRTSLLPERSPFVPGKPEGPLPAAAPAPVDELTARLDHARVLGAAKQTSPQAIVEYEQIVKKNPGSAEAQYGLAQAYAWNGELDKALVHARLAARQQPTLDGLQAFIDNLMKERKPQVGAAFEYFTQHGENFGLQGFTSSLLGQRDVTPFLTTAGEAGFGTYWNAGDHADGAFFNARAQYRFDATHRLDAQAGYHDLENNGDNATGRLQYGLEEGESWFRAGFKRELKYDSFLSLVGKSVGGQFLGEARSNLFFFELGSRLGLWELSAAPYAGWVNARSLAANTEVGFDGTAKVPLYKWNTSVLSAEYVLDVLHDKEDQSGFAPSATEPLPGGYFSPRIYIDQTPRLSFKQSGTRYSFDIGAGPSIQYVNTTGSDGAYHLGGQGEMTYLYHFTDHLSGQLSPGFTRIAEVYSRFYVTALLSYTF